jgi:hypothetical protein
MRCGLRLPRSACIAAWKRIFSICVIAPAVAQKTNSRSHVYRPGVSQLHVVDAEHKDFDSPTSSIFSPVKCCKSHGTASLRQPSSLSVDQAHDAQEITRRRTCQRL